MAETKKDLTSIKDRFASGEGEKSKRKRRSRAEIEAEKHPPEKKDFVTPESVSLLSKGLINILTALTNFQIKVDEEELSLLNTASAECLNLYLPADSGRFMPLVNLSAVLTSIAVKNVKEYRAQKAKTDADRGEKGIG